MEDKNNFTEQLIIQLNEIVEQLRSANDDSLQAAITQLELFINEINPDETELNNNGAPIFNSNET